MDKLLTALKTIKPTRTALLVATGVLALAVLTVFGMVQTVQADKEAASVAASQAEERAAEQKALTDRITTLEADSKALKAVTVEADSACAYIRQLDADRVITSRVTVPAYCNQ